MKEKRKNHFFKKLNRVMAYIYMPLLFSFLSYGIVYLVLSDTIEIAKDALAIVTSDKAPEFETKYNSVFMPVEVKEESDGTQTVKRSDVGIADYGDQYGFVRCDRIALDAQLYKGDDTEILKYGVGQNFASGQPGFGKLVLLCAHNNTFFNPLKNIEVDDIVEIETSYGTYKYKVSEMKVLEADDKSAYDFSIDHEQLVMYTCYPFDMLSSTNYRYFVYAELVSGPVFVD